MRLLTAVDQLFLLLESRKQPMHVGGLFLFELPEGVDKDFVYQLVQQMQSSTVAPTFPFNQVLDKLRWVEDEDFDIDHHFRHVALPKPARVRELLVYISKEHSRLLDRAKPLWECHVIEGIEPQSQGAPERFGLYFKIHHSLVDGIAAMRLVKTSLSQSPDEMMSLPIWSLITRHSSKKTEKLLPSPKPLLSNVKHQAASLLPVIRELKNSFQQRNDADYVGTLDAPSSILNQSISASRRLAAQSYAFDRFDAIGKQLNVSFNDVVLAVCSGAIRRYLISLNELPKKPLIAFVPISLRTDESATGNQISFLLANLGTHLEDPLRRLDIIHRSINNGKRRFGRMDQAQIINYSGIAYAWEGLNLLTGLFPKKQAFNLIISNVPGTTKPLYWNGAKLQALYPASIVFNGQALNITLASYLDKVEFGIIACSKVLPHVQDMLAHIESELMALEEICAEQRLGIRE